MCHYVYAVYIYACVPFPHHYSQTVCYSPEELSYSARVAACLQYQASPVGCNLPHSPLVYPVPSRHNKADLLMKAGTAGNIIVCDWPKNVPEFYLFLCLWIFSA